MTERMNLNVLHNIYMWREEMGEEGLQEEWKWKKPSQWFTDKKEDRKNGLAKVGVEPTTFALLARRSNQLSYPADY